MQGKPVILGGQGAVPGGQRATQLLTTSARILRNGPDLVQIGVHKLVCMKIMLLSLD